jgi:enoyl-CoA hydratase
VAVIRIVRERAHCATVLLCDARKGNPMGMEFWEAFPAAIAELAQDAEVRAIVVASEQSHFTYGLDLVGLGPELMPAVMGGMSGRKTIEQLGHKLQRAFDTIVQCPKPVIAAVTGWCIGAGVELIAACDVRVCSVSAKFSLREVRMGMVPDVGGIQRLPHIVGEGNARLLALTGMDIDAQRALAMGLVASVEEHDAGAVAAAQTIASTIAANPPRVVEGIKQVMNERIGASVAVGLQDALARNTVLMQSADFQEAIGAFIAKRAPVFQGK